MSKMPKPQMVQMVCTLCDTRWSTFCSTGQVRTHISSFATRHMHEEKK